LDKNVQILVLSDSILISHHILASHVMPVVKFAQAQAVALCAWITVRQLMEYAQLIVVQAVLNVQIQFVLNVLKIIIQLVLFVQQSVQVALHLLASPVFVMESGI